MEESTTTTQEVVAVTGSRSYPFFRHHPLDLKEQDSLRLLNVLPDLSHDGRVQCELRHVTLKEKKNVEYTCLSYVWGDQSDGGGPFSILINGKQFNVYKNLHGFLKAAREKYNQHRAWWIDALCIDQSNGKEVNHQVKQMGNIYRNAMQVVAWLGDDPRLGLALDTCRRRTSVTRSILRSLDIELPGHEALKAASLAYWKRAWITPEIALARHLILLGHRTDMDIRCCESGLIRRLSQDILISAKSVFWIYEIFQLWKLGNRRGLWNLLWDQNDKLCSILRDRIFSVISLCPELSQLDVDYTISDAEFICKLAKSVPKLSCICNAVHLTRVLGTLAMESNEARDSVIVEVDVPFKAESRTSESDSFQKIPGWDWTRCFRPKSYRRFPDRLRLVWRDKDKTQPLGIWKNGRAYFYSFRRDDKEEDPKLSLHSIWYIDVPARRQKETCTLRFTLLQWGRFLESVYEFVDHSTGECMFCHDARRTQGGDQMGCTFRYALRAQGEDVEDYSTRNINERHWFARVLRPNHGPGHDDVISILASMRR